MTAYELPDPSGLAPIEHEFWTPSGEVPDGIELVVRGSPITAEKILTHAVRQAREYSYRGVNMASVSAHLVLPSWPLERILRGPLVTYSRYGTCAVDEIRSAGLELLATGGQPHVDVVLPALDTLWADRLVQLLLQREQPNPFKSRR